MKLFFVHMRMSGDKKWLTLIGYTKSSLALKVIHRRLRYEKYKNIYRIKVVRR